MKTFGDFSTKKDWYTLLLSLLVVTLHFPNGYFARNDTAIARGITAFIFKWTGAVVLFAVMVFFVMSEYMMFRNARADQLPRKLKTRAVSLVFPLLCWNTIYFVLSHKLDANLTFRDIVSSVLFYGDNGAAWYLFNLIVFTAFCYPIFYIMKNRFTGLALIAAFAVLQILNVPFPLQLRWDSAFYYLIGAWLDMHSSKIVEIHSKSKSIIGIAGIAVLICGFAVGNALQIPALKSMSLIGCCLATWFVLDLISLPKLPKNISSVSFTIYVSHGLLLRLFSFAVLKLFAVTAYTALILFFAYPILVLIFSVYFVKLVQKSKIATMCLLGGRVKEIA